MATSRRDFLKVVGTAAAGAAGFPAIARGPGPAGRAV